MSETKLLRIGEAAKLFHLSSNTLRHYEDLGLLMPERVDPDTGYRYYGSRQFEVLNTIRYLRALDMPLAEIADFLRDRDVDRMEEKLRQQKRAVKEKLRELERVRRKIDNRLDQLRQARGAKLDEITLEHSPACRLVWMDGPVTPRHYDDMEPQIRKLDQAQGEAMVFLGKVGVSLSAEHLSAGQFSRYDGIFLLLDREDRFQGELLTLPASLCAVVRFRGSHPQAPEQYRRLMDYIRANHLTVAGFSREITMIDDGFTHDPEKFVTEIRIPVAEQ